MKSNPSRIRTGLRLALLAVALTTSIVWQQAAAAEPGRAPDWPNLLSTAGRQAAMALPKSSPWHLEPTLADIEDAARAPQISAKARYEQHIAAAGTPPNVRANNPAGDQGAPAADTQSECGVAAFGNNVVVAWNDSKGLRLGTPTTVTSYAFSCDGGQTFTDGGNVPLIAAGHQSFGDCTLDVDAAGNFYMGVIYVGATQDVAVYRGNFSGCSFTWQTPVIAASGAGGALDKPFLCVDPTNGNVYCSYTRFAASTAIEVVRGTTLGTAWNVPVVLETAGGVQGSRPAVGPEGNLYVCWQAGWGSINCDLSASSGSIRMRRSTNPAGAFTFNAAITVANAIHNWTSFWAGNVRNNGIYFPDMAVDRSGSATNGRIYVTFHEPAGWGPPFATGVSTAETEANDDVNSVNVKTLAPGDNGTGTISALNDFDYWKLNVTAGQHIMLRLEPQGFNCGVTNTTRNFQIRLFKGVVGTSGDSLLANSNINGFCSEIVFDANENATYSFRIRNVNTSGTTTGTYTVKSRLITYSPPSPARDMRDIVCARSTNLGVSFQAKVLVNDDAAGLDNCIPAIAVDNMGCVHVFFYDSRDGRGSRILRSYYEGVSTNGGTSFNANHRISNQLQYFNLNTVAVPNYGEYNQANAVRGVTNGRVYASWSDERLSQAPVGQSGVDAYVAAVQSCVTAVCAANQTVQSGSSANLSMCVQNCGTFTDDFNYSINDTQGWVTGVASSINVAASAQGCVNVTVNVPPGTPTNTQTIITLTATSASCPMATSSCTTTITADNPVSLPPAGVDCFASTAQLNIEVFGSGTGNVSLAGPTTVGRKDPVPNGPGFRIDTEMLELDLTGNSALLGGAVTLRESALYASRGRIDTPASPFFPASSFFDVFFEIDTPSGTLFNKDPYRVSATINAIPPVGSPYSGDDMLLYRKGANEGVPVARILSAVHTPGAAFQCFPPPGVDCLATSVSMTVDITSVGTDVLTGTGSTTVVRGAGTDPGDGRLQIPTEMIALDLIGNGSLVGPFHLTESLPQSSNGQTKAQGTGNIYPADSFFDVFFELELPNLGRTAIGTGPAHLQSVVNRTPPVGSAYQNSLSVPLIDKNTLAPMGTLQIWVHNVNSVQDCAPPAGIDCYATSGSATIELTGIGTGVVSLNGSSILARGPVHALPSDLLEIDTELLAMNLTGNNATLGGPVQIVEDIDKPSPGKITSQNVGDMLPADSFFDLFFVLSTPNGVLRPVSAPRLQAAPVASLPWPPGTAFNAINLPIDLKDAANVTRGRITSLSHIVGAACNLPTDVVVPGGDVAFYGLRGAYPNPFTGGTSFGLRLDQERHVSLRVYNVRGQRVRTVTDGSRAAGPHVISWDGKDEGGHTVGAGLYLYRVEVDGRSVTRKLVKME